MMAMECMIAAPAASLFEAGQLMKLGVKEIYCGILPDSWVEKFGDLDLLSRRQSVAAHFKDWGELRVVIKEAEALGCRVSLTLNQRYTAVQEEDVMAVARMFESAGGHCVIVCDLGVLLALNRVESRLGRHLSVMGNVFNSHSAGFYEELGISRVILPREMTISGMRRLVAGCSGRLEFECIVLNQKCAFIDGLCGFYHGVGVPHDPDSFSRSDPADEKPPAICSLDPAYEGHGCELEWERSGDPVNLICNDDFSRPYCAACFLPDLAEAGVKYFKIAGRGFPAPVLARSVEFIKKAIEIWQDAPDSSHAIGSIREEYRAVFGQSCDGEKCYYSRK